MAARIWSARAPDRRLATTTPSIMSASTAAHGRPRNTIDTVARPRRHLIVREQPSRRGGDVNDGTSNPRRRAARPISRAAPANRMAVDSTKASSRWPVTVPSASSFLARPVARHAGGCRFRVLVSRPAHGSGTPHLQRRSRRRVANEACLTPTLPVTRNVSTPKIPFTPFL